MSRNNLGLSPGMRASSRRVSPKTRLAPLFVAAPADETLLNSNSLPTFEMQTPMRSEGRREMQTPMTSEGSRRAALQVETMTHSMSLSFSTPSFPSTAMRPSHSGQLLLPSPTPRSQPLLRSSTSELSLSGRKLSRKSAEGRDEAVLQPKKQQAQSAEDVALRKMKREMQATLLEVCESLLQDVEKRQPYAPLPGQDPIVERCMEGERQSLKLALAKRMMHELVRSRGQPVSSKLQGNPNPNPSPNPNPNPNPDPKPDPDPDPDLNQASSLSRPAAFAS